MPPDVVVRPVTPERWVDFAGLFEARGSPHYCWCTTYRMSGTSRAAKDAKRAFMREMVLVERIPVGVLAYVGDEPVGWCSVAPRESYRRLDRSRTMPRMSDEPTWTVLCFFVRRESRAKGVARKLLEGAVGYAKDQGAAVVEAYPYDTAGVTATHRGHSSLYRSVGFQPSEGPRWVKAL